MTPIRLECNISKTAGDGESVPPPEKKFRRLASDSQNRARAAANNKAPAVLSGLDNELERYIAEISAPSDVECGLTFWQDIVRCHTPSFLLWHSISLQHQHHRRTWVLPARRYVSAGNSDRNVSVRPSVCLSVRLSRAGIVSKRRKLAS